MRLFSTGDIADETGLTPQQVAAYNRAGRLPKPNGLVHNGGREVPVWTGTAIRGFITQAKAGNLPTSATVRGGGRRRRGF